MKGNRILRICFTWVLIILSYLLFSCATTTTNKSKGVWTHQPGTFTYINPELHIKLTFPNDEWRVFTGPEKGPPLVKKSWKKYKSNHETYHGLIAISSGGDGIIMHLKIIPPEQPLFKEELEDMIAYSKDGLEMAFQLHGIQIHSHESKVIKRQNKMIGVAECQYYSQKDFTLLFTAMKEIDRYISFEFYCLKSYYTLKRNEFWNIIDSYERFYKPGYGQAADTEPKELVKGKKYIKIEVPDDFSKGTHLLQKGQYDQAIAYFDQAIGLNPVHSEAYNNRGLAYLYKAQYEKAISDFSKAIEINPNSAYAYNNRGDVFALKGHFHKAIADYNKTIEINPNNYRAYNAREYVRVIINVENYAILLKEKSRDTEANVLEERAESLFKSLQSSESSYYLGFVPSEELREYAILLRQEGERENADEIDSLADWWDQVQIKAAEQAYEKYKDN